MHLVLYNYTLAVCSLLIFLYNFFPIARTTVQDEAHTPTHIEDIEFDLNEVYQPKIDRVILVIIDALRIDFVHEKYMPFLTSEVEKNGCVTKIKVETPTVTLPRIKSLTTGSVSQFIDIVFNLAKTHEATDSFLHQAVKAGKKIVFYGDDTWLKLYPDLFTRHEGVSSFFVHDYTEVDLNVTRHVGKELERTDWDIMILHYLGLDHIGHLQGPFSPLIGPKLSEMDRVLLDIINGAGNWEKKTLIGITGDHGMRDSGGHGGSSFEEIHVPFVTVGMNCHNSHGFQTDLSTTLSALMGLKFPATSIGRILTNFFPEHSLKELLYVQYYNIDFLHKKLHCGENFKRAKAAHYQFLKTGNETDAHSARTLYETCSADIVENLIRYSVKQDFWKLVTSCFSLLDICALNFRLIYKNNWNTRDTLLLLSIIFQLFLSINVIMISAYIILVIGLSIRLSIPYLKIDHSRKSKLIIFCTILYGLSFFSSSFVEEEHLIWYLFLGTFAFLSIYLKKSGHALGLFIVLRFIRTINQTGDKWANAPDLSDWLILHENHLYLQLVFILGLFLTWLQNRKLFFGLTLGLIYIFQSWANKNVLLGQFIWFVILIQFVINARKRYKLIDNITDTWILVITLLLQPYNVLLVPACIYCSFAISQSIDDPIVQILLGKVLFFCQGHGNNLASVNVAAGYVGLDEYYPMIVFAQVFVHTYGFPVLTNLFALKYGSNDPKKVWVTNVMLQTLVITLTTATTVLHRHHLFVWTVFAPKLIIETTHSLVLFIQLVLYYMFQNQL